MEIIALIQYGTPVLLLGLMYTVVRLGDQVSNLQETVKEIKDNMVYWKTCKEKHVNVEHRLDTLEKAS